MNEVHIQIQRSSPFTPFLLLEINMQKKPMTPFKYAEILEVDSPPPMPRKPMPDEFEESWLAKLSVFFNELRISSHHPFKDGANCLDLLLVR